MSNAAALAAVRRSWTIRSSVRATVTPPHCLYPADSPVSLFEFGVQLGGVLHQSGRALRGPQLPDQPGGVPGGAAGQLALFEQHDVGDAEFGQVVGDAGADHTAADDDDARTLGQFSGH